MYIRPRQPLNVQYVEGSADKPGIVYTGVSGVYLPYSAFRGSTREAALPHLVMYPCARVVARTMTQTLV